MLLCYFGLVLVGEWEDFVIKVVGLGGFIVEYVDFDVVMDMVVIVFDFDVELWDFVVVLEFVGW